MEQPLQATPYKGTSSYQTEDARLFFGRDQDGDLLTGQILSARFTLLHAQSGAGKTSLLNARIVPGLESKGWLPVRILPQNDPVESICVTTIRTIFPSLDAEVVAIERAVKALSGGNQQVALDEILKRYDDLRPGEPLHRELIRPIKLCETVEAGASAVEIEYVPHFCRLLRSGLTVDQFNEHFETIRQIGAAKGATILNFTAETKICELTELFRNSVFRTAWKTALMAVSVPTPGLWPFFENLFRTYGCWRNRFGLVLLLDQFEEIFTRFVDSGPAGRPSSSNQPSWRLRWELMEELKALHLGKVSSPQPGGEAAHSLTSEYLPLRLVVSMRDEYVAQLDPLREFIPNLDSNAYHLALLTRDQAEAAIKRPASEFHCRYSPALYKSLIAQLTKEERYVEPAHLQIVCQKLWLTAASEVIQTRAVAAGASDSSEGEMEISEDVFNHMKGVGGILGSFFQEFLYDQDFMADQRLEILELLEPLLTPNKTRNILEKGDLIHARFRDAGRREELLASLVNRTIVRVEPRLGGQFVEITHEFLIDPILKAIATELAGNIDYTRFRLALRALDSLVPQHAISVVDKNLTREDFDSLHIHAERISWDDCSIELMLRNAILLGVESSILQYWFKRFSASEWDEEALLTRTVTAVEAEVPMTLEQLRTINENRDRITNEDVNRLGWILRNELRLASDAESADVMYWTERLAS